MPACRGEQQHQRQQPGFGAALMTAGTENGLREQEQARQMGILTGADAGLREAIKTGGGM